VIRFVTGTDTGVGKTVVAAALCRDLIAAGQRVAYYKPAQTGCGPDDPGDAGFVSAAAGVETHEGLRLAEPLAPAVAAARAGVTVDVAALAGKARRLAATVDTLVVEGAGGLLVPLSESVTMADFAGELGADLVVVARPGLGTLNHTILTMEAVRTRGLTVTALVLSGWPDPPGVVEETNLAVLARTGPPIWVVPEIRRLDTEQTSFDGARLRLIPVAEGRAPA
jgi:dethiobiotin synthetase